MPSPDNETIVFLRTCGDQQTQLFYVQNKMMKLLAHGKYEIIISFKILFFKTAHSSPSGPVIVGGISGRPL